MRCLTEWMFSRFKNCSPNVVPDDPSSACRTTNASLCGIFSYYTIRICLYNVRRADSVTSLMLVIPINFDIHVDFRWCIFSELWFILWCYCMVSRFDDGCTDDTRGLKHRHADEQWGASLQVRSERSSSSTTHTHIMSCVLTCVGCGGWVKTLFWTTLLCIESIGNTNLTGRSATRN